MDFSKYSGCGNDFIIIDNRSEFFPVKRSDYIRKLCERRTGIGADGVILLENSLHSDFRMRIFNADGHEAEMCGNGIRCLMKFIRERGFTSENYVIETYLRPLAVRLVDDLVTVDMGEPFDFRRDISLTVEGKTYSVHYLNTGVPHLIHFTDLAEEFPLEILGPKFRFHPLFSPQGANFSVVRMLPSGGVTIRTFERGVEAETLACGTGCAAAAVTAHLIHGVSAPVKVRTRSQEDLLFDFSVSEGKVQNLTMTGPAEKIFSGSCSMTNF